MKKLIITIGLVCSLTFGLSACGPIFSTMMEARPILTNEDVDAAPPEEDSFCEESRCDPLDSAIHDAIISRSDGSKGQEEIFNAESHIILGTASTRETSQDDDIETDYITVYTMVLTTDFIYNESKLVEDGGGHFPVALTFKMLPNKKFELTEFWIPEDGSYYVKSIKRKFPQRLHVSALDTQKYVLQQIQECYSQAIEHWKLDDDILIYSALEEIINLPKDAPEWHVLALKRNLTYFGDYMLTYRTKQQDIGYDRPAHKKLVDEACQIIINSTKTQS